MSTFSIEKQFHPFAVQYSPFESSKLACVASENYGLKGQGCLYILSIEDNNLHSMRRLSYKSGFYDLAWSEENSSIIITASNDGSLLMWNTESREGLVKVFCGHQKEVNSVAWSLTINTQLFVSGSWDHTIKLWDPCQDNAIETFSEHQSIVYCISWSPHLPGVFLSSSGDGNARVWDLRERNSINVIQPGCGELISCDWTKYEPTIFVTSGTDSSIRVWDLRSLSVPVQILTGHTFPARRIKSSPHQQCKIASVSYDKTLRIWDYSKSSLPQETIRHHSEFVTGIDFSLTNQSQIVDCSWDNKVTLFYPESLSE